MLFFLSNSKDERIDKEGLYVVGMDKINKAKFIAETDAQFNKIIPVSDSEVIFSSKKENEVLLYDLESDETKILPIKDCYSPKVWREKTKQLVCWSLKDREYFLTSLDGRRVNKYPLSTRYTPVLYIPSKDILILNVERTVFVWGFGFSPVWDLWAYDFATGKKERLSKENGFGLGRGIYFPE